MPTINELASTNTITGSDQFPVYVSGNGDARKASASTLLAYIQSAWMDPTFTRVTASPTLAGFTLALPTTANSLFVLLTPTGTMATGTIVLPAAASAADGQEIVLYTSQEVTVLSFTLNGATAINGAPTGIQAGASLTMRYDALSLAWYTTEKPSSVGSGTAGYLPKWIAPTTLGNSLVRDNGTEVAIGGAPGGDKFRVYGTSMAVSGTDVNTSVNVVNDASTTARYPGVRVYNYAGTFAATAASAVEVSSARGSYAAPAALLSGDQVGTMAFQGYDGAAFYDAARITALTTSNWAAARASELYFSTTNAGTTAYRLRIAPGGNVELATNGTVFGAGGTGQGLRLPATPSNIDPNVLDAYDEGTFIPVYNGAGIVGTVTFAGRYQRTANQVTVDITITTGAASTFTFTTATDYFDNFPAAVVPSGNLAAGNAIGDGWTFAISSGSGITQARFQKSGSPTFTQPANTSLRYTLATYLV
jgi:hypothetical protein